MASLVKEPALIEAITSAEVQRLVDEGELIPRERLQIAGGLELAPAGRIAALEDAILSALDLLEENKPAKAMNALLGVMPDPEPEEAEAEAGAEGDEEDAEAPAEGTSEEEPEREPERAEPAAPAKTDGRPEGMPEPDEVSTCEVCGREDVDFAQAAMSYTRFRKRLCREDFINYQKPAPEPEEPAAADDAELVEA